MGQIEIIVKKGKKPFLDRRRHQRVEEERRHLILEEEHAHSVQTNINKGKFKVEDRDYHWKSAFQDFVNDLSDPAQKAIAQAELNGIGVTSDGRTYSNISSIINLFAH